MTSSLIGCNVKYRSDHNFPFNFSVKMGKAELLQTKEADTCKCVGFCDIRKSNMFYSRFFSFVHNNWEWPASNLHITCISHDMSPLAAHMIGQNFVGRNKLHVHHFFFNHWQTFHFNLLCKLVTVPYCIPYYAELHLWSVHCTNALNKQQRWMLLRINSSITRYKSSNDSWPRYAVNMQMLIKPSQ